MKTSLEIPTFYGILDTTYVAQDDWIAKYDALVKGGAGIVQLRAKAQSPGEYADLVEQIVAFRNQSKTPQPPLILNHDVALALKYPGVGVHIRTDEQLAKETRQRLGPDRILGLSAHSPEEADQIASFGPPILDYFSMGPVFQSPTKRGGTPVGLEMVRHVAAAKPSLPFFCIGGITRSNIAQVRDAGANRIISVSDVLCADDTAAAVRECIAILAET